jgi:hypothetical protein
VGDQTLVRLSCLDDDAQGNALQVLWESEVDASVVSASSFRSVQTRGFDDPKRFAAYLHVQRWSSVTSTDAKLFQAPYRAGIEVQAYQLEPLRKALLLPRVNLFIADDVGVGKTIEAGLILRELLMRQKVRRVVVACPPSVVIQWRDELESRFGLSFAIFDRDFVIERRKERGYAVNPWSTHSQFILSHALLRDEAYAAPLRDWLEDGTGGSLLILDEAHNAAPASSSKYAVDSKLTRVVRDIAPHFEHRLFLSATPHNGHSNSFAALLEILDPQRFCRGVKIESTRQLEPVMVRRLKEDLREVSGGFPERLPVQIDVKGLAESAAELRLPILLDEYRRLREGKVKDRPKNVQAAASLICISLQKRLLSSIEAFRCTLRVHRASLEKAKGAVSHAEGQQEELFPLLSESPGSDDDRAELPEAEVQAEEEAQMEAATSLTGGAALSARERQLLDEMTRIAEDAASRPDGRIVALVDWIRKNLCPGLPPLGTDRRPASTAKWNERRVLIFTEYTDTKRYLEEQLGAAIAFTDQADLRIDTFHGGITDDNKREAIKRAFNQDPAEHPLRILIATDAAREGVNLQNHCADLFHFDIPWNPSRMEQRNGRIDRKQQRSKQVRCHYFLYTQRPEDRVLQVLIQKTIRIRKELGSLGSVVEGRLAYLMERGIPLEQVALLAAKIDDEKPSALQREIVERELEETRERKEKLEGQIAVLRKMLGDAERYIGLDEEAFRQAISCSLEILGTEPLAPIADPSDATAPPVAWRFPALDRRRAADPSWLDTLDTLRKPRRKDEDLREWRRSSPIRPIIFKDAGSLDDDKVHLHLEHRVAQRLLGRFLGQGFVHDDLSRATVLLTKHKEPLVVLYGRLALYGDGAARLHDEILSVAALWVEPSRRKGALKALNESERDEALRLVEASLGDKKLHEVDADRKKVLGRGIEQDVEELFPRLEARGEARARSSERELGARAEKEAAAMAKILEEQAARIRQQQESPQLELAFTREEKRQLDADRAFWGKRLLAIGGEIQSEPEKIRQSYAVRARRVELLGVVYLWPKSG